MLHLQHLIEILEAPGLIWTSRLPNDYNQTAGRRRGKEGDAVTRVVDTNSVLHALEGWWNDWLPHELHNIMYVHIFISHYMHAHTNIHTHTANAYSNSNNSTTVWQTDCVWGGMCGHVQTRACVCVKVHRQIDRRVCAHCITHLDVCWFFELVKLFLESLSGRLGLLWTQHKTTKDLTHCKVEVSSDGGNEEGGWWWNWGRRVVRRKSDGGSEGRRGEEGWWYWEISVLDTVTTGR